MLHNKYLLAIILVASAILISGCANKLTTAGSKTRQIDRSWMNQCKFLGSSHTSSSFKLGGDANYQTVKVDMRNITGARGGNAYVVNDFTSDGSGHYQSSFEMYKCPDNRALMIQNVDSKPEKKNSTNKYEDLEKVKSLYDKGIITEEEYKTEKTKMLNK